MESGETLVEGAHRELLEETGVDAEVGRLVLVCEAIEPGGRHLVNMVFSATKAAVEPPAGAGIGAPPDPAGSRARDPAIQEVRWVTRAELLSLELHPPIAEAVAAAWADRFDGEVLVLGNVWVPDPRRRTGAAAPGGGPSPAPLRPDRLGP